MIDYLKALNLRQKIRRRKFDFDSKVNKSIDDLAKNCQQKRERHQFISSNFEDAVAESSSLQIAEHDRKKRIIDEINNSIYGALGELQVVNELKKLSDEYVVINDFSRTFYPSIYNRKENEYIKSIQIDHLLLGPSGIFLIETKNWSERSLNNLSLRSPVQQIKRTNYALFRLLNSEASGIESILSKHHWGDRKISFKNLIVSVNYKPVEEFKYVKVLTLNELLRHIKYFEPCFSKTEIQSLTGHLLALNVS